jgi:hypothetical protein
MDEGSWSKLIRKTKEALERELGGLAGMTLCTQFRKKRIDTLSTSTSTSSSYYGLQNVIIPTNFVRNLLCVKKIDVFAAARNFEAYQKNSRK